MRRRRRGPAGRAATAPRAAALAVTDVSARVSEAGSLGMDDLTTVDPDEYRPDDVAGTLEDAADRDAAQRIADFANNADEPGPDGFAGGWRGGTVADALQGTASYVGLASGFWATRAAGSHLVDQGGFSAAAIISADFNGPGVTVSGSITVFTPTSGRADMTGWRVNLVNGGTTARGPTNGDMGSMSWKGVWDGGFSGSKGGLPSRISGRFQAESGTPRPIATPEGRINLFADRGFAGVQGSFSASR